MRGDELEKKFEGGRRVREERGGRRRVRGDELEKKFEGRRRVREEGGGE